MQTIIKITQRGWFSRDLNGGLGGKHQLCITHSLLQKGLLEHILNKDEPQKHLLIDVSQTQKAAFL